MDDNWKRRVLQASERLTPEQEQDFVNLVNEASGKCSLEIARILMKTFSAKPDYGTQEHVNSALATADREVALQAILEELPRLEKEAPEWAECLIAQEINFRPALLEKALFQMPRDIQLIVKNILDNEDVVDSSSQAAQLRDKLTAHFLTPSL